MDDNSNQNIIFTFILQLCEKYGFMDKTRMQAIYLVDMFMRKNKKVDKDTLQLVGITAIIVAVKINEDRFLSFA